MGKPLVFSLVSSVLLLAVAEGVASADDAASATVVMRSPNTDVTVGYVTGRATAVASNGVVAEGIEWKDVCIAPCSFQLPSGLHEITVTGPGYVGGIERFQLRPGENRLVARPGSAYVRVGGILLGSLGLAAAVTGGTFMLLPKEGTNDFQSWALPLLLGGLGATGVGVAMMVMSSTSIEQDSVPPPPQARIPLQRAVGMGYAVKF